MTGSETKGSSVQLHPQPSTGRAAALLAAGAVLCAGAGLGVGAAHAVVCAVPSAYASVGEAAGVPACTEIVLAAGVHVERVSLARSLTLRGAGTAASTLRGAIDVQGDAAGVELRDFTIDTLGCTALGLQVSEGAEVKTSSGSLAVLDSGADGPCPLFRDGFATGAVGRWSAATPP